jgi:hypothetical protein
LKTCTSSTWRLFRPCSTALAELGVPEQAVRLRVPRLFERREVAEHVEQVAAVPERIDQPRVACAGVLGGVTVLAGVADLHESTGGDPRLVAEALAFRRGATPSKTLTDALLAQCRTEGDRAYRVLVVASVLE